MFISYQSTIFMICQMKKLPKTMVIVDKFYILKNIVFVTYDKRVYEYVKAWETTINEMLNIKNIWTFLQTSDCYQYKLIHVPT